MFRKEYGWVKECEEYIDHRGVVRFRGAWKKKNQYLHTFFSTKYGLVVIDEGINIHLLLIFFSNL